MPVLIPISDDQVRRYFELRCQYHSAVEGTDQFITEVSPVLDGKSHHAIISLMRDRLIRLRLPTTFDTHLIAMADRLPQAEPVATCLAGMDLPYADSLVICDPHFPHHHQDLLAWSLEVARVNKVRRLILAGDVFDFDCFSSYLKVEASSPALNFSSVAKAFDVFLDQFDMICVIMGNHDERLVRRLDLKMGMGLLLNQVHDQIEPKNRISFKKRVIYTDRYYMTMYDTPDRVAWRISHPDNYRKVSGSVSKELAQKYQCHFLSAHQHHWGTMVSPYGRYYAVDGGCLVDPIATEYIQRRDKASTDWMPGFTLLLGGKPYQWCDIDPQPARDRSVKR